MSASTLHLRLPIKDVVSNLAHILGAPIVAVLGGAKSTRSVRQWMSGEVVPGQDGRLRVALSVVHILQTREKPDVIRAWFAGNDPHLDDKNPVVLLAEQDGAATRELVIAAARNFISEI
jgi:hypothetical protein